MKSDLGSRLEEEYGAAGVIRRIRNYFDDRFGPRDIDYRLARADFCNTIVVNTYPNGNFKQYRWETKSDINTLLGKIFDIDEQELATHAL